VSEGGSGPQALTWLASHTKHSSVTVMECPFTTAQSSGDPGLARHDGRQRNRSRRATLTHMGSVGVRALQQHASEVVRRAAAGEVVEITDRGRPVARLVPTARTTLEGLVTAGLARPARSRLDEQPPPLPARRQGPSLSDLLAEARQVER
jgi:prevent-host-death family protein